MVSWSSAIFRSFSIQSLQYAIQGLPEVSCQRIAKDVLQASVGLSGLIIFAPAGGKAEVMSVGRFIAGTGKPSGRVHKRLEPYDRMVVDTLPV